MGRTWLIAFGIATLAAAGCDGGFTPFTPTDRDLIVYGYLDGWQPDTLRLAPLRHVGYVTVTTYFYDRYGSGSDRRHMAVRSLDSDVRRDQRLQPAQHLLLRSLHAAPRGPAAARPVRGIDVARQVDPVSPARAGTMALAV